MTDEQTDLKPRLVILTDDEFKRMQIDTPNEVADRAEETGASLFLGLIEGASLALHHCKDDPEKITTFFQEFADLINRHINETNGSELPDS